MQKKPVKGERDGVEIESSSECALSKRHYVIVASIDVMTVFGMLSLYRVCYFHIWYVIPTMVSSALGGLKKKIDLISLKKNPNPPCPTPPFGGYINLS